MDENEKKMLAFMSKLLFKVVTQQEVDTNEIQSLCNIVDELGGYEINESEFRY